MEATRSPFQNLSPEQIYARLTDPTNDLPTWPEEEVQAGYTAMKGPAVIRRTQPFIDMLDKDGAFKPGWEGLDYGAGWGRIAALLLAKGTPEQLDLVDAWSKSLSYIEEGGFKNHYWKVPEILGPGDIPEDTYTFVYAFSVFTHLSEKAFWTNLHFLRKSIRSPGTVYFTVRHRDFAKHAYPGRLAEISTALKSKGFWFTPTQPDRGIEPVFGAAIVSRKRLRELGPVEHLGTPPHQWQHVYALRV